MLHYVMLHLYDNDHVMLVYRRSSAAISLIGLVMAIVANTFTYYSLNQLRYMFKRLAATMNLITGCIDGYNSCGFIVCRIYVGLKAEHA